MVDRIIPNFFIVGAPKCGTTALSEYLRSHPNVFISRPKEPCYFCYDFPNHRFVNDFTRYIRLFAQAKPFQTAVGEASVWYLFSEVAVPEVMRFNPHARILVMIRNPIQMIYSFHSQAVLSLYEDEIRFEYAWRKQEERKCGLSIPRTCKEPAFLQYAAVGSLGAQVERLLKIVPRDRVKLIVFDDFVWNTQDVYESVLGFLDLPPDGRTEFPKMNANRQLKNRRLATGLQDLERLAAPVKRLLQARSFGIGKAFQRLNTQTNLRPQLDPAVKKELGRVFQGDIEKLSRILDRDLTFWLDA